MKSALRPGIIAAIAVLALDQASKLWLLFVFDLAHRGAVKVTSFFDLVLAWNVGISFGWFQNDGQLAQIILMLIKAVAVVALAIVARVDSDTSPFTIFAMYESLSPVDTRESMRMPRIWLFESARAMFMRLTSAPVFTQASAVSL